ncbi:MAG: hypothetical protein WCQ64_17795, partial [Acidobacteriota bacterium]
MKQVATALIVLAGLVAPRAAGAEIVRLTTGATISVKSAIADGDTMVMVLRGGGEMRTPRSIVAEVLPDEVLHAEAASTFVLPAYVPPPVGSTVPE